ncbi:MAG: hypothetical protein BWY76_00511 [bacterium ADurb.Bin429]|nr:MAG: hypothetical protein BWY76_00511 [bacterium ADurb.Bin429]
MHYLIWGVAVLVLLFIVGNTESWLLSWLVYFIALLALAAITVVRRRATVVSVSRHVSHTQAEIGQPVSVDVTVNWQGPSGPGWVLAQDGIPDSFRALGSCGELFIAGDGRDSHYSYRMTGQQRGYFSIGPLRMSTGDLFGMAQTNVTGDDHTFLTIYPKIVPIPPLRIPSNRPIGDARSSKRIYEDTTRIVGVRDYLPGDTFSKIHWKTSARLGTLATKMCEPSTSIEVNIVLNMHYGDYPPIDTVAELACTAAASVAASLLDQKHLVGMQTNGYDAIWKHQPKQAPMPIQLRPDKGPAQLASILNALGRMQLSSTPALSTYLTQLHSTLPWTASTLIISHHLSDESLLELDALKKSGFEIVAIIVGPGSYAENARMRVAALGIPVAWIRTEKELATLEFWQPGRYE